MPVPSAISDLSQTAGSNNPPGSESPTTADDYFRAYASFIAMLRDGIGFTDPVQLASATTTSIGAQNAMFVEITGTTTITGFGTTYNGPRFLRFTGALTLTHNSTTLNLPGAANITTAAGDTAIAIPNYAGNGWNVVDYQVAAIAPGVATNVTGTVAVANGGTGGTTALAARANLEIEPAIFPVAASVSSNALTLTLNPCLINFRSTTLGTGTTTAVTVSGAITLTISSGSTLGTVNAIQSRIAVLAINNAGTVELAAVNIGGGVSLDESGLISTTAEGGAGAADSATTIYSTTARSNVTYRVVAVVESTQATAGTWATSPSLVQGAGGEAMTSMQSIGFGQTWQNMTGSRSAGSTYYNATSRPISVCIASNAATTLDFILTIGGVQADRKSYASASNGVISVNGIVPAGASYALTANSGTVNHWSELR